MVKTPCNKKYKCVYGVNKYGCCNKKPTQKYKKSCRKSRKIRKSMEARKKMEKILNNKHLMKKIMKSLTKSIRKSRKPCPPRVVV